MAILKRLTISGYKSIEHADIELRPLNVLIGGNGAGKSNLLSFFKLVREMQYGRLQSFVADWGADALLFFGPKTTKCLKAGFHFSDDDIGGVAYRVELTPTSRESLAIRDCLEPAPPRDLVPYQRVAFEIPSGQGFFGSGAAGIALESLLPSAIGNLRSGGYELAASAVETVVRSLQNWGIYHFADTSSTAAIRRRCYMHDNLKLHSDGSNLAAVLWKLQKSTGNAYWRVLETIRQVAPWFGDFSLEPIKPNETDVVLNWRDRHSDSLFGPHQLPDGALRAMALITLLLQREEDLPSLIVIDEPELGLHPAAITVITALLRATSLRSQVIIATQSVTMLEEFDAGDVIVVDRDDGRSTFTRQDPEQLKEWLEEYTLGELWQKNSIGGGPF